MSLKNRWNCILDFFHRRIILIFLVLLTGIAVFIYFSSGAYSPQPGNLSYHLVECLVEEYVRWSESRTATLGGVESERRGSLAAGKMAPAGVQVSMMNNHDFDLNELPPEHEQPPVEQPELSYSQRLEAAQTRRFEQKELLAKSVALSEILKKYPDPEDDGKAREEVLHFIFYGNQWLYRELLGNLEPRDVPIIQIRYDYETRFFKCVERILACQGKEIYNLKDLVDLKYDLENERVKYHILQPYFARYGKSQNRYF